MDNVDFVKKELDMTITPWNADLFAEGMLTMKRKKKVVFVMLDTTWLMDIARFVEMIEFIWKDGENVLFPAKKIKFIMELDVIAL